MELTKTEEQIYQTIKNHGEVPKSEVAHLFKDYPDWEFYLDSLQRKGFIRRHRALVKLIELIPHSEVYLTPTEKKIVQLIQPTGKIIQAELVKMLNHYTRGYASLYTQSLEKKGVIKKTRYEINVYKANF